MSINKINKDDLENDFSRHNTTNDFPIDIFPEEIQKFILESSEKLCFSTHYLGAGILTACSAAIRNSFKVYLKSTWIEKANLYVLIVGSPGDSKSHSQNYCFRPLINKDKELFKIYQSEVKQYLEETKSNPKQPLIEPVLKRFLINDFTPEALIKNHNNNQKGFYVYVDELNGWLNKFNRYNNSGDEQLYLEFWSGYHSSKDRSGAFSTRIDDPFIGITGGIQISTIKNFGSNGKDSNGFMDRLLFVFPDFVIPNKWNLKHVDVKSINRYDQIILKLIEMSEECEEPKTLKYTKEAEEYLVNWQNNRPTDFMFTYERSIEMKMQEYVLRFSLILQLLDNASNKENVNDIGLDSVKGAIKLFHYFRKNAIKVRELITYKEYWNRLTKLQKDNFIKLPDEEFTTAMAIKKVCKSKENPIGISIRTLNNFLKDKKLFIRIDHGLYKKIDQ